MTFLNPASRPIVVGTPLKSGTWLIRQIVSTMTGLPWFEPEISKGITPSDPNNLALRNDAFFSWHFVPESEIQRKLVANDAYCIFVVRNVFAITLSMYHHFADNIDWEIGRGANQVEFFSRLTKDQGIRRIIKKERDDMFNWQGIGGQLHQIQKMLEFAAAGHALVLTFEKLVDDKAVCIRQIANFLNIEITESQVQGICEQTAFSAMREQAIQTGGGSHFRTGLACGYFDDISMENRALLLRVMEQYAAELPEYAQKLGVSFIVDWNNRY